MKSGIFDSPLFVTIICLVLVFAMLSLLVSTLTEGINSYFQERGRILYRTIGQLFEDGVNPNFGQLLYTHPMVDNLKKDKNSLPQYISAEIFSKSLLDVISNWVRPYANNGLTIVASEDKRGAYERFAAGVNQMAHTPIKLLLLNMLDRSVANGGGAPFGELERELQQWYNDHMDRVSGWYKTWTRTRLFWVALVVTLALNVDSIYLFQCLYRSPDLRARLEPVAEGLAANYATVRGDSSLATMQQIYQAVALTRFPSDSVRSDSVFAVMHKVVGGLARMDSLLRIQDSLRSADWQRANTEIDDLESLGLPVGWHRDAAPLSWFHIDSTARAGVAGRTHAQAVPVDYFHHRQLRGFWNIVFYLLGVLITVFSISAGAPFWFDLLLKLVNLRGTGVKPANSKK